MISVLDGTEPVHLTELAAGDRVWLPNVVLGDDVHAWAGPVTIRSAKVETDTIGRPFVVLVHDREDLGTGVWLTTSKALDGARGVARRFVGEQLCAPCGREHQPREHPVPCGVCRQPTAGFHAVCEQCEPPAVTPSP